MEKEKVIKILEDVCEEIKKRYKVKRLGLFGSIVRGEESKGSDIDILTEFEDGADLFDLTGLTAFLEEKLKCEIDIVSRSALREELRDSIEKEVAYI